MIMTPTTWNGILIVALFAALGIYKGDDVVLVFALAMAGLSYITNVADELEVSDYGMRYACMAVGFFGYVYAAFLLFAEPIINVQ